MTETTSATLRHAGGELELPRIQVVEGNEGYDVSKLLKQTGAVTFDPGFMNTAATTSAITYIDGDAGILRYRGYPIEQLAQHSSFLEVSYLLIYGNLPTPTELEAFDQRIRRHTLLHEELKGFFSGFPRDAHPMPVLSSAVSALSTFYQDSLDPVQRRAGGSLHIPAHGQDAGHRRLRPQEDASASRCCTRTTPSTSWRTSCA